MTELNSLNSLRVIGRDDVVLDAEHFHEDWVLRSLAGAERIRLFAALILCGQTPRNAFTAAFLFYGTAVAMEAAAMNAMNSAVVKRALTLAEMTLPEDFVSAQQKAIVTNVTFSLARTATLIRTKGSAYFQAEPGASLNAIHDKPDKAKLDALIQRQKVDELPDNQRFQHSGQSTKQRPTEYTGNGELI